MLFDTCMFCNCFGLKLDQFRPDVVYKTGALGEKRNAYSAQFRVCDVPGRRTLEGAIFF